MQLHHLTLSPMIAFKILPLPTGKTEEKRDRKSTSNRFYSDKINNTIPHPVLYGTLHVYSSSMYRTLSGARSMHTKYDNSASTDHNLFVFASFIVVV